MLGLPLYPSGLESCYLLVALSRFDVAQHTNFNILADWWEHSLRLILKQAFNVLAIYIVWNLWKEQNYRIFENTHANRSQAQKDPRKHGNPQEGTLYSTK